MDPQTSVAPFDQWAFWKLKCSFPLRGGLSPSPSEAGLFSQTHRQTTAWCLLSGALSCCETIPLGSRRFHPNSAGPGSARRWAAVGPCVLGLCIGSCSQCASVQNSPGYSSFSAFPNSTTIIVRRNLITVLPGVLDASNCITHISQPRLWRKEL